jgi:hypothetical protein
VNEAWILLSIGDAGGVGEWADPAVVLVMADSINHLVPTRDDLSEAGSNLVAAGLVETDGLRMRLTESGAAIFIKTRARRVGHIRAFLDLADEWRSDGSPAAAPRSWSIDEAAWRAALATSGYSE